MFKKLLAEFIGTFFLVFVGTGSILVNSVSKGAVGHIGISFAFGLVIFVMIYSCARISGAHFNPSVTITFLVIRKINFRDAALYILSQILGAVAGSGILKILFGSICDLTTTQPSFKISKNAVTLSIAMEFFFTFLLMYIIASVTNDSKVGNTHSGIVIGISVFIGALIAGPISGGSFNPARTLGPAIICSDYKYIWIYMFVPTIAAILAALTYSYLVVNKSNQEVQKSVSKLAA
jgi:aquaporin Z